MNCKFENLYIFNNFKKFQIQVELKNIEFNFNENSIK